MLLGPHGRPCRSSWPLSAAASQREPAGRRCRCAWITEKCECRLLGARSGLEGRHSISTGPRLKAVTHGISV